MEHYVHSVEMWPNILEVANVLQDYLYVAMASRTLNILKRASGEVVEYNDAPDLFISD